ARGRSVAARETEAALDWFEAPRADDQGRREGTYQGRIPLSGARTGELRGGVDALALVPRTQFLYALVDGRAVVIETHGAAPYASVPVRGTMLGVDGTGDELLVLADGAAERIETGRHAFAWRVPGVLLAAVLAFFLVLLARRLFASDVLPAIVGIAVVLDGSMFAQARIGMNDIYVATFIVVGWYFVVAAHRPRRGAWIDLALAGIAFGLDAASKWVAFYAIAAVGLASVIVTARAWAEGRPGAGGPLDLLAARRWASWRLPRLLEKLAEWLPERMSRGLQPLRLLVQGCNSALLAFAFVVIPVTIYVASYLPWFGGATAPYGWSPIDLTKQMYWYHSGLTAPHPAGSPWWSWPLVLKPVYWYLGQPGAGATAVIYDTGNVVLYWGGLVAVAWAAVAAARARSVALAFLLFAMLAQYVAWIPIARVLFFYHFFTALPFYLLILAAGLAALWESGRRVLVVGYLAIAAGVLVFFYPFISGQPVPADQAGMFYILPTWQYDCQFYPSFRCNVALPSDIPAAAVLTRVAIAAAAALGAAAVFALTRDGARARLRTLVAGRGRG
ncbi:MAG: phospholipid carrier-dependent glycosyltransferase, partial [Chloroflexota bacterium]